MIPQHLLLRLLNTPRRYKGGEATLTFGKLPNHLPIELPIIKRANVAASVSYSDREFYIFLDIPGTPQKIQITYRNVLLGRGWRMLQRNKAEGNARIGLGFSNRFPSELTESTTYCNRNQNASLRLTTSSSENSITKATLKLDLSYSSCQASWEQDSQLNNIPIPIFIEPLLRQKSQKASKMGEAMAYGIALP